MRFSLKSLAAAMLLAAGSFSANAALYDFSYTASFNKSVNGDPASAVNLTFSGTVDGTLQGDGNTVVVSDIVSVTIDGHSFTDLINDGTFTTYLNTGVTFDNAGTLTLDGSLFNLVGADDTTSSYLELYSGYAAMTVYYSSPIYTDYTTALPFNSSWTMALQSTGGGGGGGGGPISAVPEPASALLMLAGVPLLMAKRRKAKAAQAEAA